MVLGVSSWTPKINIAKVKVRNFFSMSNLFKGVNFWYRKSFLMILKHVNTKQCYITDYVSLILAEIGEKVFRKSLQRSNI